MVLRCGLVMVDQVAISSPRLLQTGVTGMCSHHAWIKSLNIGTVRWQNLCSVPRTHIVWLTTACDYRSKRPASSTATSTFSPAPPHTSFKNLSNKKDTTTIIFKHSLSAKHSTMSLLHAMVFNLWLPSEVWWLIFTITVLTEGKGYSHKELVQGHVKRAERQAWLETQCLPSTILLCSLSCHSTHDGCLGKRPQILFFDSARKNTVCYQLDSTEALSASRHHLQCWISRRKSQH